MGSAIIGSGISVPARVVTNGDLARIMDTDDEWITRRTGVRERRFADPGTGSSDLGAAAGHRAIRDAGLDPADVDLLITATMTPDSLAPGIAGLIQAKLGLRPVAAYDLRQQCSGFLYGLDLADAMLASGRAETALVIGAEVHGGFQPWSEASWTHLLEPTAPEPSRTDYDSNTQYRAWSVLFGDGAGAAVLQRGKDPHSGILATSLHSDGTQFDLIHVPGVGFSRRPYIDAAQLEAELHLPTMKGRELFRRAVTDMPAAVSTVAASAGVAIDDLELVMVHQANSRIVQAVGKALGLAPESVPINIDRYGNTTAATLGIVLHEMRSGGRMTSGSLAAFTAFGAGAHWGAALYREP